MTTLIYVIRHLSDNDFCLFKVVRTRKYYEEKRDEQLANFRGRAQTYDVEKIDRIPKLGLNSTAAL